MGRRKKKIDKNDNIILTHEEYRQMKLYYNTLNNKIYKKDKKIDNIETKNA